MYFSKLQCVSGYDNVLQYSLIYYNIIQ